MDEFKGTLIGLVCALFSGVVFGSQFTPLKKYDIRDGFFVQWIQSATIFVCGMIVTFVQEHPRFEPVATFGGFIFATANIAAIPLVNKFGAGLAILFAGTVQIIVGWATGRFGLFGIKEQIPDSPIINYVGVALTLGSGIMFALVKYAPPPSPPEWNKVPTVTTLVECPPALETKDEKLKIDEYEENGENGCGVARTFQTHHFFLIIAVLSGALSGQILTPVCYVMDNVEGASQEALDYVFSHFCGIFSGSTFYFIIYCLVKKNKPYVSPEIILPSVLYGAMWSCAMMSWFISNKLLSQAISFPIVTRIPGIVGACWDVFYFKSVSGTKNLLLLTVSVTIAVVGVILVGLSK